MGSLSKAADRMSALREISERDAHALLTRQLVGAEKCDQVARDCALLRSCAWALTGGARPVHILRLLNFATSFEVDSDKARTRIKDSLDELAEAGDLAELANGRWLPAPTRAVRLDTRTDIRLLVGGLPSSLLPPSLRSSVEHNGACRRMIDDRLSVELELPSESERFWLGEIPSNLEQWTTSALNGVYEPFRDEGRRLWVYAPELPNPATTQLYRWTDRTEKLSGRYLGRMDFHFGLRTHYAVEIVAGKLSGVMGLSGVDLRRLQYGLDARAARPIRVTEETNRDQISFVLKSELPRSERRFFAALGRLSVPEGAHYPKTWTFAVRYADDVRTRLANLGISLVSKKTQ